MRKIIALAALFGVSGCALLPFGNPPLPSTPATPVYFQPFSTALDPAALHTIATAAQVAAEEPDAKIIVAGAADNTGDTAGNEALSRTRAKAVADQLVTDGVDKTRITAYGIGQTGTLGDMSQYSRRVLIKIGH
jgi:outer membrane protein OmpA-like peptidoglycan-associated protein